MASICPGAHRRHRALAGADADDGHVAGLQPGLGEDEVDHHVGRAARRGDADLLALQVGHRLVVGHRLRVHAQHDHRRAALQHEGAHRLALELHVHRVLEGARHHVGAAAHHRLQRARAAGEVDDGQVQPFGLEVAQLLGNGQRQVVQQVLAADGDAQLGLFQALRAQQRGGGKGGGGADEGAAENAHVGSRKWHGPDCPARIFAVRSAPQGAFAPWKTRRVAWSVPTTGRQSCRRCRGCRCPCSAPPSGTGTAGGVRLAAQPAGTSALTPPALPGAARAWPPRCPARCPARPRRPAR